MVEEVNNIETSEFVLKTNYDRDKSEFEKKISGTSRIVKKADYNVSITETKNKIPSISRLGTNTALTSIENKIPNISSLVKKQNKTKQKKQIMIQKWLKSKKNWLIWIMKNILLAQSLISWHLKICCKIKASRLSKKKRYWWKTKKSQ